VLEVVLAEEEFEVVLVDEERVLSDEVLEVVLAEEELEVVLVEEELVL
jgi:hypothetical protein